MTGQDVPAAGGARSKAPKAAKESKGKAPKETKGDKKKADPKAKKEPEKGMYASCWLLVGKSLGVLSRQDPIGHGGWQGGGLFVLVLGSDHQVGDD